MRIGVVAIALAMLLTVAACVAEKPSQEPANRVSPETAETSQTKPEAETNEEASVALQVVAGIVVGTLMVAGAVVFAILSASDARLKTEITRVGVTDSGLPLYTFRYLGDRRIWRGVMAQDVLAHTPKAVVTDANGYMYVRYRRLGLRMTKVGRLMGPPPEGRRQIRKWRLL